MDVSILTIIGINFSRASDIGCLSVDLHPYDVVRVFKVGVRVSKSHKMGIVPTKLSLCWKGSLSGFGKI